MRSRALEAVGQGLQIDSLVLSEPQPLMKMLSMQRPLHVHRDSDTGRLQAPVKASVNWLP